MSNSKHGKKTVWHIKVCKQLSPYQFQDSKKSLQSAPKGLIAVKLKLIQVHSMIAQPATMTTSCLHHNHLVSHCISKIF